MIKVQFYEWSKPITHRRHFLLTVQDMPQTCHTNHHRRIDCHVTVRPQVTK